MALKQFKRADGAAATANPSFFQTATGIAVSVGVLFITVWVISKAWRSGQKQA
jgi:hypothetical protein